MSNQKNTLNLATKIKKARQEAGYSQQKLAEALKLSNKTISAWEVGRAQPHIRTLKKIAEVTKVPTAYFVDELSDAEFELKMKLSRIEEELAEVRRLLEDR